ncbi:3940_t:CDS:2 [Entrophospora sp. SA101]|nr:3940_t:CDS:2 [Entrophospora sp. SA101]
MLPQLTYLQAPYRHMLMMALGAQFQISPVGFERAACSTINISETEAMKN